MSKTSSILRAWDQRLDKVSESISNILFKIIYCVYKKIHFALRRGKTRIRMWKTRHTGKFKSKIPVELSFLRVIARNDQEGVRFLLEQGVNADAESEDGISALHLAVRYRRLEIAQLLLRAGANIESRHPITGETVLICAAKKSDAAMVSLLLRSGAKVDAYGFSGLTALMYAANQGHFKVTHILLEGGADPNWANAGGHSAREYALKHNRNNVANLFERA